MGRTRTTWKTGETSLHDRKPKRLSEKHLALITQLASRGCREMDIHRAVDMSAPTWIAYKREHPECAAALAAGQQALHDRLVADLLRMSKKGNVIPALFLLKSRFQYDDRPQGSPETAVHVQIVLPAPMDAVAYARTLEAEGAPALPAPGKAKHER